MSPMSINEIADSVTDAAVLFDFDGTILDTAELICTSLARAVKEVVRGKPPCRNRLLSCLGMPLTHIMQDINPQRTEELVDAYRWHYHQEEIPPIFNGIESTLSQLVSWGYELGLVTSKSRSCTLVELREYELEQIFSVVVASDDVRAPKPDPEPVLQALNRLNCVAEESLMVGDSSTDMIAGKGAGVSTGWARWGVPDLVDTDADQQADYVFDHPEQVLRVLPQRQSEPVEVLDEEDRA